MKTSRPETLRCGHCGAPVWLKSFGARAACPYCRQPVWASERILAAFDQLANGLEKGLRTFRVQRRSDAEKPSREAIQEDTIDWVLGALTLVAIVASYLVNANYPKDPWAEKIFTGMCILASPVMILIYARRDARSKAGEAVPLEDGACPACGVRAVTSPRATTNACGSCGANPLLPPGVDSSSTEANDARLLGARMARFRRDRADWHVGKSNRFQRPPGAGILFLVSVLFALLIVMIGQVLPARKGRHRSTGTTSEGLVPLAFLVCLGGGTVLLRRRRPRSSVRWDSAATTLRAELEGTWVAPLSWVNSVWAGPVPRGMHRWGMHTQVVGCQLNGYPVLLMSNTSSITLLLAAWTPGVSDEPDGREISSHWRDVPGAVALVSALDASDFDVVVTPAGLIGSVCQNSMSDFRVNPERLVELVPAVRCIADLATAIHARPVDAAVFGVPEPGASASSNQGAA